MSELKPKIIQKNEKSSIKVDAEEVAQTMQDLGISEEVIASSAIVIDPKNRFINLGTHYPNRLGRWRFSSLPEIQEVNGNIMRISTRIKGKDRTEAQMNRTLVHELEHAAQADRHDKKLTEGHIAIYGLAMIGALLGNKLGKSSKRKLGSVVAGAFVGYQAGYLIAPHERQARQRAGRSGKPGQVTTAAIKRKV